MRAEIWLGTQKGRKHWRPRLRREDDININFKEMRSELFYWNNLAQDTNKLGFFFLDTVMKLLFPQNSGNILTGISMTTLLQAMKLFRNLWSLQAGSQDGAINVCISSDVRNPILSYCDACTVHLVQFIIQTNNCTTYIPVYKQYFIYRKYSCMFRCTCIIFREP